MKENENLFKDYAIVSCGVMVPELNALKEEGFLDGHLIYTAPGLHQSPAELETQLLKQLEAAKQHARKIIVVYGGKYCYINMRNPLRTIDSVIDEMREEGYLITRTQVENCLDLLASPKQREELSEGRQIWWGTPGWLKYRDWVFKGWDKAHANENFGQYTEGIILDPIGFFDAYAVEHVEEILDFSDWASIPLSSTMVSLERIKNMLLDARNQIEQFKG
jgi:hypothetical protein